MTVKSIRTAKKFRIYKAARRELTARFPEAFPRAGRRPPLKVGILDDLRAHDIGVSMTHCRLFLRIWTHSTAYLKSVSPDAERVGLDGVSHGGVLNSHVTEARSALRSRRARRARLTAG